MQCSGGFDPNYAIIISKNTNIGKLWIVEFFMSYRHLMRQQLCQDIFIIPANLHVITYMNGDYSGQHMIS